MKQTSHEAGIWYYSRMAQELCVVVSDGDRVRLEAIVSDRNRSLKLDCAAEDANPPSAPCLGRRSAWELGSTSCPAKSLLDELGAVSQHAHGNLQSGSVEIAIPRGSPAIESAVSSGTGHKWKIAQKAEGLDDMSA
jgi:hypothetical protein